MIGGEMYGQLDHIKYIEFSQVHVMSQKSYRYYAGNIIS